MADVPDYEELKVVDIENFKSIDKLTLELEDGFTVIVGPNGSGKSNLLEAISFGLGEKIINLRVASLREMAGPNGDDRHTVVDLTFSHPTIGTKVVSSAIKENSRVYLLNKVKTTKKIFDAFVHRDLGFAKEKSCFNIRQRAAQQVIASSPLQLLSMLRDAAGSQALLDAQVDAEKEILVASGALEGVARQIQDFDEALEQQRRRCTIIEKAKETRAVLERTRRDGCRVAKCVHLSSLFSVAQRVRRAAGELLRVVSLCAQMAERLRVEKVAVEGEERRKDTYRQIEEDRATRHEKLLSLREGSADLRARRQQLKQTLSVESEALRALEGKWREAVSRREVLQLEDLPRAALQKGDIAMRLAQNHQQTETPSSLLPSENLLHSYTQRLHKLKAECRLLESRQMDCTAALIALELRQHDLEEKECQLVDTCRGLLLQQGQSEEEGGEWEVEGGLSTLQTLRERESRLLGEVRDVHGQKCALKRQFGALIEELGHFGADDWGSVCDLLVPAAPASFTSDVSRSSVDVDIIGRYGSAMGAVLGGALGVRVCSSLDTGLCILDAGGSVGTSDVSVGEARRAWPLDEMEIRCGRSEEFCALMTAVQQTCPNENGLPSVVDPATLLTVAPCSPSGASPESVARKALCKACGGWLLVDSDDTAAELIRLLTERRDSRGGGGEVAGAVSLSGNIHTVGCLRVKGGGSNTSTINVLSRLSKYHECISAEQQLGAELSKCRDDLRAAQQANERVELVRTLREQLDSAQGELAAVRAELDEVVEGRGGKGVRELRAQREGTARELSEKNEQVGALQDLLRTVANRKSSGGEEVRAEEQSFHAAELQRAEQRLCVVQEEIAALQTLEEGLLEERAAVQWKVEADEEHLAQLEEELREALLAVDTAEQAMQKDRTDQQEEDSSSPPNCREQFESLCVSLDTLREQQEGLRGDLSAAISRALQIERGGGKERRAWGGTGGESRITKRVRRRERDLADCSSDDDSDRGVDGSSSCEGDNLARLCGALRALFTGLTQEQQEHEGPAVRASIEDLVGELDQELDRIAGRFASSLASDDQDVENTWDASLSSILTEDSDQCAALLAEERRDGELRERRLVCELRALQQEAKGLGLRLPTSSGRREGTQRQLAYLADSEESSDDVDSVVLLLDQNKALRDSLQLKHSQIELGLSVLSAQISFSREEVAALHRTTLTRLRRRFRRYFADMVPGSGLCADLVPARSRSATEETTSDASPGNDTPDMNLEDGLVFVLTRNRAGSTEVDKGDLRELSGGQQVLLALSFLFACALLHMHSEERGRGRRSSPVYLLDEVDAALDEGNQRAIATAIGVLFAGDRRAEGSADVPLESQGGCQVVCVSHNEGFQKYAQHVIRVSKKNGRTVLNDQQ